MQGIGACLDLFEDVYFGGNGGGEITHFSQGGMALDERRESTKQDEGRDEKEAKEEKVIPREGVQTSSMCTLLEWAAKNKSLVLVYIINQFHVFLLFV